MRANIRTLKEDFVASLILTSANINGYPQFRSEQIKLAMSVMND